ncbi:MAG TPA: hypothetical protein PLK14_03075, partial [Sediminibacterium sp.]|nr:hypothetical protein [Sediminibacterium sp.]
MIRGSIRRYYDGENDFEDLIKLIETANVTFQRVQKKGTEKSPEYNDEIQFNYTKGLADYRSHLYKRVDGIKSEFTNEVISQSSRFEKLVFISSKVAELQRAINNLSQSATGFSHSSFTFSNLSAEEGVRVSLTEADIQEYYEVMKKYSDQAMDHIKILEASVQNSSNDDFPQLKPVAPDPNEPSNSKPLAFFDYFYASRGFTRFHNNFYPNSDEDYYNVASIDKDKEVVTYEEYNPEDGEPYTYTREFKQELLDKVYSEFLKAKKFIDAQVNSLDSEASINLFLKLLLYQLRHLHNALEKYPEATKYDTNHYVLKAFVRFIFDKYEPFVENHKEVNYFKKILNPNAEPQPNIVPSPVTQRMLPHKEVVMAFKWVANPAERTTKLYTALVAGNFISRSFELMHISKGFEG